MNAKKKGIYKGYLDHLLIKGLAKTTVEVYSKEAKEFLEYVDDVEHITRAIVLEYIAKYFHLSYASRNFHSVAVKSFTRYLKKNVYFNMNEINIPHIKIGRKLPKILDQKEFIEKLNIVKELADNYNWMYKRNYALIILMYATGMRVSEALNFKRSDIDENSWVRIDNGKGSKDRYVPIAESAIKALDIYAEECPFPVEKNFFVMYLGEKITRMSVLKIVKKNMGLTSHGLRHHYATHMIINGSDVIVVSELLGHSSLHTTQIYTHIKKPQLAKSMRECHPMAIGELHAI